ncbi:MAG TPA: helix-hairpin-helix domain-containing protein [Longimicrobiaceae bacterium]
MQDPDAIGTALERERLSAMLGAIQGVGAQRVGALAERYGTIWNLRQADVGDLTRAARIPRPLAERIRSAI